MFIGWSYIIAYQAMLGPAGAFVWRHVRHNLDANGREWDSIKIPHAKQILPRRLARSATTK
jgi:hypothetical protein